MASAATTALALVLLVPTWDLGLFGDDWKWLQHAATITDRYSHNRWMLFGHWMPLEMARWAVAGKAFGSWALGHRAVHAVAACAAAVLAQRVLAVAGVRAWLSVLGAALLAVGSNAEVAAWLSCGPYYVLMCVFSGVVLVVAADPTASRRRTWVAVHALAVMATLIKVQAMFLGVVLPAAWWLARPRGARLSWSEGALLAACLWPLLPIPLLAWVGETTRSLSAVEHLGEGRRWAEVVMDLPLAHRVDTVVAPFVQGASDPWPLSRQPSTAVWTLDALVVACGILAVWGAWRTWGGRAVAIGLTVVSALVAMTVVVDSLSLRHLYLPGVGTGLLMVIGWEGAIRQLGRHALWVWVPVALAWTACTVAIEGWWVRGCPASASRQSDALTVALETAQTLVVQGASDREVATLPPSCRYPPFWEAQFWWLAEDRDDIEAEARIRVSFTPEGGTVKLVTCVDGY